MPCRGLRCAADRRRCRRAQCGADGRRAEAAFRDRPVAQPRRRPQSAIRHAKAGKAGLIETEGRHRARKPAIAPPRPVTPSPKPMPRCAPRPCRRCWRRWTAGRRNPRPPARISNWSPASMPRRRRSRSRGGISRKGEARGRRPRVSPLIGVAHLANSTAADDCLQKDARHQEKVLLPHWRHDLMWPTPPSPNRAFLFH